MCVRTVRGRHLLKCNLEWIRHAISCCSCVEFLMDFRKSNVHDFLKQILFLSRESAILLTHYREKEIKCVDISFPSRFFSFFNLVFVTNVEGDGSKMNNNNSFSSCAFSRPAGHCCTLWNRRGTCRFTHSDRLDHIRGDEEEHNSLRKEDTKGVISLSLAGFINVFAPLTGPESSSRVRLLSLHMIYLERRVLYINRWQITVSPEPLV